MARSAVGAVLVMHNGVGEVIGDDGGQAGRPMLGVGCCGYWFGAAELIALSAGPTLRPCDWRRGPAAPAIGG
jgi:hypothetical protein